MRQLELPDGLESGSLYAVSGEEYHYLARVLRLKPGASIKGRDPEGRLFGLRLERRDDKSLYFRVIEKIETATAGETELVLCICLPKLHKMDLIVRMVTEAGAARIVPLTSVYSAVREKEASRLAERVRRWEKIARSGLEQSGRRRALLIDPVSRLADLQAAGGENDGTLSLFAWERHAGSATLHGLLAEKEWKQVRILVGPEGGISPAEGDLLMGKGFVPVWLGENILRTETAAIALCAAVNIVLLEKSAWNEK